MRRRSLETLLRDHLPADPREASFQQRMLVLTREASDPFARDCYAPGHFTASAFVVPPESDAVLLIYHQKLRRWLQPGGHIELGDSDIVAAARREVREETGLDALEPHPAVLGIFDIDIHPIPARPDEPAHAHFDVRILFKAEGTRAVAGSDAEATRWVALDRFNPAESDASVVRAVRKLRALASH